MRLFGRRWAAALAAALMVVAPLGGVLPALAEGDAPFAPVYTRADLESMAADASGKFRLCADIDLSDAEWMPFAFSGELDGAGYAISGLHVTTTGAGKASAVDGNGKGYKATFAGLFSRLDGAFVHDLTLTGARVAVETADNCFAALLAGRVSNARVERCQVDGEARVTAGGAIGGVGGLVGYADGGVFSGCVVRATAVYVDTAPKRSCEQFLGGLYACGWADALDCEVTLSGSASVYGYAHNGGLIGMYRVTPKSNRHAGTVSGCTVSARIAFFERAKSRRAYCEPLIGETLNTRLTVADNAVLSFEKREFLDAPVGDDAPPLPDGGRP